MYQQKVREWTQKWLPRLQKYRYVWLILLAGLIMLCMGSPRDAPEQAASADLQTDTSAFDLSAFQDSLQQQLSRIEGAGQVELLLSMEDTETVVYASNTRTSESGENSSSYEDNISIVSDGSYGEQPVRVKSICPTFRGAVVLCEGGGSTEVRWAVTQAVSAACGLRTDKITVLKMQSASERKDSHG